MKRLATLLAALALVAGARANERIVSASGPITEIVSALGGGDRLVAVDTSSVFPESVAALPRVGYSRQLSAEGVLSVNPSLVLVPDDGGPPAVIEQIRTAGVRVEMVGGGHGVEAAKARIARLGELLGADDAARGLCARLDAELATARAIAATAGKPKVLFVYARAGGVLNVAGEETAAASMIELAGGVNAARSFRSYKPLTAEAAVEASPDVILATTRGLETAGGVDGLLSFPGLQMTPAGRSRRVVAMDDLLLLGFGPRLGSAVCELATALSIRTAARQ